MNTKAIIIGVVVCLVAVLLFKFHLITFVAGPAVGYAISKVV